MKADLTALLCSGKKRFKSFTRAQAVAHAQAKRYGTKFAAYICEWCKHAHVGTHIGPTDSSKGAPDSRQRYAVFAALGRGKSILVGFTNAADGGRLGRDGH